MTAPQPLHRHDVSFMRDDSEHMLILGSVPPNVSRMCPATDRKGVRTAGQRRSAKLLVKGTFPPIRHAPEDGSIRLLIRRLWVRVPPPELQTHRSGHVFRAVATGVARCVPRWSRGGIVTVVDEVPLDAS